jgi:hypothetical protein
MKLSLLAGMSIVSICLLTSCAYIRGRNEDNAAAQSAQTSAKHGKVVDVSSGAAPAPTTPKPNASETAAKMMAPLTQ